MNPLLALCTITLLWNAPTTYEDGRTLDKVPSYRLYLNGTSHEVIDTGTNTSWSGSISEDKTVYATAYIGALESKPSNSISVPCAIAPTVTPTVTKTPTNTPTPRPTATPTPIYISTIRACVAKCLM